MEQEFSWTFAIMVTMIPVMCWAIFKYILRRNEQ